MEIFCLHYFDLKSAYHHIEISPSHKTYVGFSWNNADKKCFYEFNVLPFGLATAPFIFTKMRVVISWWRSKGHKVVMFLDDGLGGCSNFDDAVNLSKEIQTSLQDFGFLIAHDKCVWEPSQVVQWLGFKWCMTTGMLHGNGCKNRKSGNCPCFPYQAN